MEYTDDNLELIANKVADNMDIEELRWYVAEDFFFRFEHDSELFDDYAKEFGVDNESN